VAADFERRCDFDIFIDKIGLRLHIFFGDQIKVDGKSYYSLVVFNVEHFGDRKTCKFQKLSYDNGEFTIRDIDDIDDIDNLYTLFEYLMYNEKLTDYKTIRKKLFELLKDKKFNGKSLFKKLNIPEYLFEMDYLPEVMTADKEHVSRDFYINLPESINDCKKPENEDDIINITAESTRSKRPNILKRHVYRRHVYSLNDDETDKYYFFSKNKDSKYYNSAIICDDNIYIGICYPEKKIIKFYPIDENLFSRFTYPFDFSDLVYLFFPYIYSPRKNYVAALKLFKFYNKHINSTIQGERKNGNLHDINLSESISIVENEMSRLKQQPQQQQKKAITITATTTNN
jgi:hypothetical protein